MIKNNLPLPNLNFGIKLIYSSLLLGAVFMFLLSWSIVLSAVYPDDSSMGSAMAADVLGVELGMLAADNTEQYRLLLGVHIVSVIILLVTSLKLFQMTALRRRAKLLIQTIAIVLAFLDFSAWIYAPHCSSTNAYVGAVGALSAIPLLLIALTPLYGMWVYKRWTSTSGRRQRVLIVGGGFAGLYAAMGLNRKLGYSRELEITVLDRNNYFLFPPLLPSAAAGTIETRQVTYPFRRLFETTNIVFRKLEVSSIDPERQLVCGRVEHGHDVALEYDFLVLAPGSVTQTFGTKGVEAHCYFMRELGDSILIRNRVIDCFERAAALSDPQAQKELLRFVVVGAGPTGIETATEISDLIHKILLRRYPEIAVEVPEVCIIQSGAQILPGWEESVVRLASKQLQAMPIRLLLNSRVSEVGAAAITLTDGTRITSRTVIWCAGVKPSPLLARCGLPLDKAGRVPVEADLRVSGRKNVFVLGDAAALVDQKTNQQLPPLGQVAFQQGTYTAKTITRLLCGEPIKPFRYFNFGGLVSVGEHYAAVQLMGLRLSGFIGWIVWRSLYLGKIVGVSNKIRILIDWTLDLLIERSITQLADSDKPISVELTRAQQLKISPEIGSAFAEPAHL